MCRMLLGDSQIYYPWMDYLSRRHPACRCHVAAAWGSLGGGKPDPTHQISPHFRLAHLGILALTILSQCWHWHTGTQNS
jgi:hypothetical protein